MIRNITTGKCEFCERVLPRQSLSRHLSTCGPGGDSESAKPGSKAAGTTAGFLLFVDGGGPFFLHLFAQADATLDDLDSFLRGIWLECCGHLSGFRIEGTSYSSNPMDDFSDQPATVKLRDILYPKLKLAYDYDFGSTTRLNIKVVAERSVPKSKRKVVLAARNEKPVMPCAVCKEPAVMICKECRYGGNPWFCKRCSRNHDCGEDLMMPYVNSPRTGVCGYTG